MFSPFLPFTFPLDICLNPTKNLDLRFPCCFPALNEKQLPRITFPSLYGNSWGDFAINRVAILIHGQFPF